MDFMLKNLHNVFNHVPVAMLIFSFIFDLIAALFKRKEWNFAGLLCLVVGALGAIAAVLTGPAWTKNPLFPDHQLFGQLTMVAAIVLLLTRLVFRFWKTLDIGKNPFYLVGALVMVILVAYTGHLGGEMIHKKAPTTPAPAQVEAVQK